MTSALHPDDNIRLKILNEDESDETEDINNNQQAHGTTLAFANISYMIDSRINCCSKPFFCQNTGTKQILFNISGVFKPGLNAILGNNY